MKRICFLRIGLFKYGYNLILVLCMKRILFFTSRLILTWVQPNSSLGMKRSLFSTNWLMIPVSITAFRTHLALACRLSDTSNKLLLDLAVRPCQLILFD